MKKKLRKKLEQAKEAIIAKAKAFKKQCFNVNYVILLVNLWLVYRVESLHAYVASIHAGLVEMSMDLYSKTMIMFAVVGSQLTSLIGLLAGEAS